MTGKAKSLIQDASKLNFGKVKKTINFLNLVHHVVQQNCMNKTSKGKMTANHSMNVFRL